MYKLIEIEDTIRIPPNLFSKPLKEAALEVLKENFEGKVIENIGVIVSILDVDVSEYGYLTFNDGSLYHTARFKVLAFSPVNQEVVEGEVVLVEKIGITVRLGAVDVFVHRSQVFASRDVIYEKEQGIMMDQQNKRYIRKGDIVRARVTGISYDERKGTLKIRMTMRQPYLGKLEYLKQNKKKEEEKA